MKKQNYITLILTILITVLTTQTFAAKRYWVGGNGNFNQTIHWSLTDGGATGASVPLIADTAFVTSNSGPSGFVLNVNSVANLTLLRVTPINLIWTLNISSLFTLKNAILSNATTVNGNFRMNGLGANVLFHQNGANFNNAVFFLNNTTHLLTNGPTTLNLAIVNATFRDTVNVVTVFSLLVNTGYLDIKFLNILDALEINSPAGQTNKVKNLTFLNPLTSFFKVLGTINEFQNVTVYSDTLDLQNTTSLSITNFKSYGKGIKLSATVAPIITNFSHAGSCLRNFFIKSLALSPLKVNANFSPPSFLTITNVNETNNFPHQLSNSTLVTSTGFSSVLPTGRVFYWVNDAGSFSDSAHWSLFSGGSVSGCFPANGDKLVFDANSFSMNNQQVIADTVWDIKGFDWSTDDNSSVLLIDSLLKVSDSVKLNANLIVKRTSVQSRISFEKTTYLNTNAALIHASCFIFMTAPQVFKLENNFITSDSASLYYISGNFNSQTFNVKTNSIELLTLNAKQATWAGTKFNLKAGWYGEGVNNLNISSQPRMIELRPSNIGNAIISDVTITTDSLILASHPDTLLRINIDPTKKLRSNKIVISPKSHLLIDSASTISYNSLFAKGSCLDTISIQSYDNVDTYKFEILSGGTNTTNLSFTKIGRLNNIGTPINALFSRNSGGNSGISFAATQPVVANFIASPSFCFGDTVAISNSSTTFSNGIGSLKYSWYYTTGDTIGNITGIVFPSAGLTQLVLTATDTINGCKSTDTSNFSIYNPVVLASISESSTTICAGIPVEISAQSTDPAALFEFFLNGVSQGIPVANRDSVIFNNLATSDLLQVSAVSNGCLGDTLSGFLFTIKPRPIVTLLSSDSDTTICLNTLVNFTAAGANKYQFFNGNTAITAQVTSPLFTMSNLQSLDSIYVIGKNTLTDCSDTSGILIWEVNPLPIPTLSESSGGNVLCAGDAVIFTAGGGSTYQFFVNATSQNAPSGLTSFTSSNLTTGQIVSVKVFTTAGCALNATQTFSYIVNPIPFANLLSSDADTSICQGEAVTFTANGGTSYQFFVNGISQGAASGTSNAIFSTLVNNDSVYVQTGLNGCFRNSSKYGFEVRNIPTTSVSSTDLNDTICLGTSVIFTGIGATQYQFLLDGNSVSPMSAVNTYTTSSLTDGQILTVVGSSNNCLVSDAITTKVLALPPTTILSNDNDNIACAGEAIGFSSANAQNFQLMVNGANFGASNTTGIFNPILTTGANNVRVLGTASNGCSALSGIISIQINPIPVVSISSSDANDTICNGTNVQFTGTGATFYQFFINGTSQTSLSTNAVFSSNSLLNNQNISVLGSSLGCQNTSPNIQTTVFAIPLVDLTSSDVDNQFCNGTNVIYTATGATLYEFSLDGLSLGAASSTSTIGANLFNSGSHILVVQGTTNGCQSSDQFNIQINPVPTAVLTSSDADNIICSGSPVTLTAATGAAFEFLVNGVSTGFANTLSNYTTSVLANGNTLQAVVFSTQGCSDTSNLIAFTVNPTPAVLMSSSDLDNQICAGTSVTFLGSGATNFQFVVNGISQGPSSSVNNLTVSNLTTGSNVQVIGTSGQCANNSNAIVTTVFQYPEVLLTNLGDSNLCDSDSASIEANGAIAYQFFINGAPIGPMTGATLFEYQVPNGGVVSAMGTSNGCSATSINTLAFTVTATPLITAVSSDSDLDLCLNQLVNINTSGASQYLYELNGISVQNGNQAIFTTNQLTDGDEIKVIGRNNNCVGTPQSFVFNVNSINLTLTSDQIGALCFGSTPSFTANGADLYQFFLNQNPVGTFTASNVFLPSSFSSGDQVTVQGQNTLTGCTQNLNYSVIPVILNPTLISTNDPIIFCEGDSAKLNSTLSYGITWTQNNVAIPNESNSNLTVVESGTYAINQATGGNGELWSKGYNGSGTFGDATNFNSADPKMANSLTNLKAIETGGDFAIALSNSGSVYSWGVNGSGQLGNGTFTSQNSPVQLPSLSNIQKIAVAGGSVMALTNTGTLYVWGNNVFGQLGTGSFSVINFPFLVSTISNVQDIVGGKNHFIALKNDGTVWTVGNNAFGQLGINTLVNSSTFVQTTSLSSIESIGSGENHSFAINQDKELFVWGNNVNGQLGLDDLINRLSPVLSPKRNVSKATGGATHSLILDEQDALWVSGDNTYGQLGINGLSSTTVFANANISGLSAISASEYTSLVLTVDQRVFACGYNQENQILPISGSVNTFIHLVDFEGVSGIEAGKRTSHAIYGFANNCSSNAIAIQVNPTPQPTITMLSGPVLETQLETNMQWFFNGEVIPGANAQMFAISEPGIYSVVSTNASGCSSESLPFNYLVVGLSENDASNFSIYPNPTTGMITVKLKTGEFSNIQLLDVTGRIVFDKTSLHENNASIDLSNLPNGCYSIRVDQLNGGSIVIAK